MASYINPADSFDWQSHRMQFEHEIFLWCQKNKVSFYGTSELVNDSKFDKIIKLTVFELIDSFEYLQQLDIELGTKGQTLFYLTDNLIDTQKSKLFKNINIISIPQLIGMVRLQKIDTIANSPLKLFNCFIQRVDSVRQSWFYFLKHHDLLKKGYVSFLLFQYPFYSDKTGLDLFDCNHYRYNLDKLEHFHNAYLCLRNQVPYRNFLHTDDLYSLIKNTKYSLVLETYAVDDDHIGYCYTEKLYRAIQSPTINLLFTQKNSLTKLSKLGFKIDDWLLEIDSLPWIERQTKLLTILVDDYIEFSFERLYNNAVCNRDLIADYRTQFLNGDYLNKILTGIIET